MYKERFDKVKKIIQRECKSSNLSTHEFVLLDNFLAEVNRELINKPVETTKEQPNFEEFIKDFRKEYPGFSSVSNAHFYTFYDFLKRLKV